MAASASSLGCTQFYLTNRPVGNSNVITSEGVGNQVDLQQTATMWCITLVSGDTTAGKYEIHHRVNGSVSSNVLTAINGDAVKLEPHQDGNDAQKWFFDLGHTCAIFTNYRVPTGGASLCMSTFGPGADENVGLEDYPPPTDTWTNWSDTGLAIKASGGEPLPAG
jgi:hypothetical protein